MHSHYTIPIQCTSSGGNKLAKMTTKPFVLEFTFTAYTLECSVCLFVCIRACALLSLWNRFVKITAFKSNLNDFIQFKQFKWFSLHRWSAKQKQATVFLPLFISFELSFSISISRLPPFRWWYSCVFSFGFCLTLDIANRDFLSHCVTEREKKNEAKESVFTTVQFKSISQLCAQIQSAPNPNTFMQTHTQTPTKIGTAIQNIYFLANSLTIIWQWVCYFWGKNRSSILHVKRF